MICLPRSNSTLVAETISSQPRIDMNCADPIPSTISGRHRDDGDKSSCATVFAEFNETPNPSRTSG